MTKTNPYVELRGLSHTAYVCSSMTQTVDFYEGVLGMPLAKTLETSTGGQHFFFDIGNGAYLGFVMVANAGPPAPGIATPEGGVAGMVAVGGIQHIAFDVAPEKFDDALAHLDEKGVRYQYVNHVADMSEIQDVSQLTDRTTRPHNTFARSAYFSDPDGIMLEFCAWQPAFDDLRDDIEPAGSVVAPDARVAYAPA